MQSTDQGGTGVVGASVAIGAVFNQSVEARVLKLEGERNARLTFAEARERLLDAMKDARQAHVKPGRVNGDLFGPEGDDAWERRITEGVQVFALEDFNTAIDSAFPLPDESKEAL